MRIYPFGSENPVHGLEIAAQISDCNRRDLAKSVRLKAQLGEIVPKTPQKGFIPLPFQRDQKSC